MRGHESISSGFPHDDGDQHRSRLRSVPRNGRDSGAAVYHNAAKWRLPLPRARACDSELRKGDQRKRVVPQLESSHNRAVPNPKLLSQIQMPHGRPPSSFTWLFLPCYRISVVLSVSDLIDG